MKWPLRTLGQLASFRNGLNFNSASFGIGLKVVNVADFKDRSTPDYESVGEINPQGVADDKDLLAHGDIIFVRSNGNRDLVGRSMLIRNPPFPVSHSAFTIRLRFEADGVSPAFYSYFFRSPLFRKQLSLLGAGTNICNLNQGILRDFSVPYPVRAIQDEIADLLSTYDNLIENNLRRMALLEESARLLYKEWFVHLRFPGHEHTRIINGVPEGWEKKVLGDLCESIRETVAPDSVEPDTPYIGLEHMPRRSISLTYWATAEAVTSSKNSFKADDILFGKIRPYFHKVGIAFTDGVASSDAIVIRPFVKELRSFVLMTVSSDSFIAEASQTMREGSKMPRADWKLMTQFPIVLPPHNILNTFSTTVSAITDQLRNLCFQNQKLKAARDLLLPKLMSGEMEV